MPGSITASCGHVLKDDEDTVDVEYRDTDCDAVDGIREVTVYASFCPACAKTWSDRGDLLSPLPHHEAQS